MAAIRRFLQLWLPVIFWAGFIFYLSSIPNLRAVESPFWDEIIRSILHGFVYTILYLLIFRALNFSKGVKDYWLPFGLAMIYALTDEVHQHFIPSRSFQLKDLGVDLMGVLIGFWVMLLKVKSGSGDLT